MRRRDSLLALSLFVAGALAASPEARRNLELADLASLRVVSDPRVSPDGEWVAYTVTRADFEEDRDDSDVWMARWDGSQSVRLTTSPESESSPRWSPDGKSLAFLSGRGNEDKIAQVWVLNRAGGEAERLTQLPGGVSDFAWSPDGKRLVLAAEDADPEGEVPDRPAPVRGASKPRKKTKPPIVIDRFQFKADETGYLGKKRTHLYLFDLGTRKADALTSGANDELLPAWSPAGNRIAFVSKRGSDPDRNDNWDVFVIDARPGAPPQRLTSYEGADAEPDWASPPAWSPDGKSIAYLQGGDAKLIYYSVRKLAVVPSSGGTPRLLAGDLDRNVSAPAWSPDGRSIFFLVEDDRTSQLAAVAASGGSVRRLLEGRRVVSAFSVARDGRIAALVASPNEPEEIFGVDAGGSDTRRLSRQNDAWLSGIRLGKTEELSFSSRDGTPVNGFLVLPPDAVPDRRLPTVLRVHGGPVDQFANDFQLEWQLLAARGYAVVAANPRGSSGRGENYSMGIFAAWGEKDVEDVLAAVDAAVARGVADPQRLGIGGWSYGGMLTNYTIARDQRFAAAVSGASISNILAGYGTDQYVREYEAELGVPWRNLDAWLKVSYPFLHADRIVTPTLFLCGDKDFNVPLQNSEQMYQALRSLGRETQLVIYPGEYHALKTPSYRRDRYERSLAWYDRFLSKSPAPAAAGVKAGPAR